MEKRIPWNKIWTKDKCLEEAKRHNTRTDFMLRSGGAYSAAQKNKWLDEIYLITPIPRCGNRKHKCIYVYEFSDNYVYVGLTYNIEERQKCRNSNKNDAVMKHINETNLQPIRKQLTDYIDVADAINLEEFYVIKYKNEGWNILNRFKTGGLGGGVKLWTYDNCKNEALKYNYRNDFRTKSKSAYRISLKNKWINEICEHMNYKYNKWTKEKCLVEAKKYKTKTEFRKNCQSAYVIANNNKWLDEICLHMLKMKKNNNYWTKKQCLIEAKKYKTINEFRKNEKSAYVTIIRNGWLNNILFLEKYIRV